MRGGVEWEKNDRNKFASKRHLRGKLRVIRFRFWWCLKLNLPGFEFAFSRIDSIPRWLFCANLIVHASIILKARDKEFCNLFAGIWPPHRRTLARDRFRSPTLNEVVEKLRIPDRVSISWFSHPRTWSVNRGTVRDVCDMAQNKAQYSTVDPAGLMGATHSAQECRCNQGRVAVRMTRATGNSGFPGAICVAMDAA